MSVVYQVFSHEDLEYARREQRRQRERQDFKKHYGNLGRYIKPEHLQRVSLRAARRCFWQKWGDAWDAVGRDLPKYKYWQLLQEYGWGGRWERLADETDTGILRIWEHPVLQKLYENEGLKYLLIWQLIRKRKL